VPCRVNDGVPTVSGTSNLEEFFDADDSGATDNSAVASSNAVNSDNSSLISNAPATPATTSVTKSSTNPRRPVNSLPSGPVDSYREWVKGNDVSTLVKHKLSASAEARRLKAQKNQEDERRALLFMRRMQGCERDEFFDERGVRDPVYQKLKSAVNLSDESNDDMELL
jgi:hypothetical protein